MSLALNAVTSYQTTRQRALGDCSGRRCSICNNWVPCTACSARSNGMTTWQQLFCGEGCYRQHWGPRRDRWHHPTSVRYVNPGLRLHGFYACGLCPLHISILNDRPFSCRGGRAQILGEWCWNDTDTHCDIFRLHSAARRATLNSCIAPLQILIFPVRLLWYRYAMPTRRMNITEPAASRSRSTGPSASPSSRAYHLCSLWCCAEREQRFFWMPLVLG
jgi:hypothetical protein